MQDGDEVRIAIRWQDALTEKISQVIFYGNVGGKKFT